MVRNLDLNLSSQKNTRTLGLGQSPDHILIANLEMDESCTLGLGQRPDQTMSYKIIVVLILLSTER